MGRIGRKDDEAPRVVGFDFGAPRPAPASYVPDPAAPPPPPPSAPPASEYAPVQTLVEAPPAPYHRPGYVPPAPLPVLPPAKGRTGVRREATVLLVLLLVLGVVGGVLRLRSGSEAKAAPEPTVSLPPVKLPVLLEDLNAPATIGGQRRFFTPLRLPVIRALHELLPNHGRFAEVEVYGDTQPRYAIIAGAISKGDSRRVFEIITGKTPAGTVSAPRAFPGGMVCANNNDGSGAFCVWGGTVSDGFVMRYGPGNLAALARTTVQARRDLERGH